MRFPKINTMRIPELLMTLRSIKSSLIVLKAQGKPYDRLIDFITALPGYDDYDEDEKAPEPPNGKQMQATLKITSNTLRKWMLALYDDLLAFSQNEGLVFTRSRVYFRVKGPEGFFMFITELKSLPRIGEGIELPFLLPMIGEFPGLYVKHIYHTFIENEVQTVLEIASRYEKYSSSEL